MKKAKLRHRVMAGLIDALIVTGFCVIFFIEKIPQIVAFIKNTQVNSGGKILFDALRMGLIISIFLSIYYVFIPFYLKGQTIGKKIFKIKVVNQDNSDLNLGEHFLREVLGKLFVDIISIGISLIASFIILLVREDRHSIADMFAKTKVIDVLDLDIKEDD